MHTDTTGPERLPSPYEDQDTEDLVLAFWESDAADRELGRELSVRMLLHAGHPAESADVPIRDRSGTPVVGADGTPLTLRDYVNYAVDHHFDAVQQILDFLYTKPGEPEYEAGAATFNRFVGGPQPSGA